MAGWGTEPLSIGFAEEPARAWLERAVFEAYVGVRVDLVTGVVGSRGWLGLSQRLQDRFAGALLPIRCGSALG